MKRTGVCVLTAVGAMMAASLTATGAASAQDLPRRAPLGVTISEAEAGGSVIQTIIPGLTGEALGVQPGDRVHSLNGRPILRVADLVAAAAVLRGGDAVNLVVERQGAEQTLTAAAVGLPLESHPNARTVYGAVPFREGRLRDILIRPDHARADGPVVFLLPGHNCMSIERPTAAEHPYSRLIDAIVQAGISVYRVEKPGMGDSTGTPACDRIDFHTELAAFQAGYDQLTRVYGVEPRRVILFGHSMGVLQAPLLAAGRPVGGIAVFGGGVRNWHDYFMAIVSHQGFLMNGADPVEAVRRAEAARRVIGFYYLDRRAPEDILAADPDAGPHLALLGWQGGDQVMGHHYSYWQDLAHIDLIAAWRDSDAPVLSLYGEADLVALNDEDHRLIAAIANHYRPGEGRYVALSDTDHMMTRPAVEGGRTFDTRLTDVLIEWISAIDL